MEDNIQCDIITFEKKLIIRNTKIHSTLIQHSLPQIRAVTMKL
jgi:hypothetical protein